jgi:hypothetical protein
MMRMMMMISVPMPMYIPNLLSGPWGWPPGDVPATG